MFPVQCMRLSYYGPFFGHSPKTRALANNLRQFHAQSLHSVVEIAAGYFR